MTGTVTASTNGSDGFFSTVSAGVAQGLASVFTQVLPVWAAQQAKLQSSNQLNQPTYVTRDDIPRIDDQRVSSGGFFSALQRTDNGGYSVGGIGMSVPLFVGGAVLLVGLISYFALRKR